MRLLTALLFVGLPMLYAWAVPFQVHSETPSFSTHVSITHGKQPGTFQIGTKIVDLGTGQVLARASLVLKPGKLSVAESINPDSKTIVKLEAKVAQPPKSAEYNLSIARSDRIIVKHSGVVVLQ